MNFIDAVSIVISGIFTVTVVHGDMSISPLGQTIVNGVFIGIEQSTFGNACNDEGLNGALLDVVAEVKHELAPTLNHAQHRWFIRRGSAASSFGFQPPFSCNPSVFLTSSD